MIIIKTVKGHIYILGSKGDKVTTLMSIKGIYNVSLASLYVVKLNLRLLPGAKAGSVVVKDGSSPPQFCSTSASRDNFSVCSSILMHFPALNRAH